MKTINYNTPTYGYKYKYRNTRNDMLPDYLEFFTDKNLQYMPRACAGIDYETDGTILVSYSTDIAVLTWDGYIRLSDDKNWHGKTPYSRSTSKHIKAFLKEMESEIDYDTIIEAHKSGYMINIYYGDLKPEYGEPLPRVTEEKVFNIRRRYFAKKFR